MKPEDIFCGELRPNSYLVIVIGTSLLTSARKYFIHEFTSIKKIQSVLFFQEDIDHQASQ